MKPANLLAQNFSATLMECELLARRLNPGGAVHALASRQHLDTYLAAHAAEPLGPMQAAAWGASTLRKVCFPLTLGLDAFVGTGRTHFAPGERPEPDVGQSQVSHQYALLCGDIQRAGRANHDQRLDWLGQRVRMALGEHPCDAGVAGLIAGAIILPLILTSSIITSAAACLFGACVWAAHRLGGDRLGFVDTVTHASASLGGWPTLMAHRLVPPMGASFNVSTRIGLLTLRGSHLGGVLAGLQAARVATGALKLGIALTGALICAPVGVAALALRHMPAWPVVAADAPLSQMSDGSTGTVIFVGD
jgi:hypothetical protein